MNTNQPDTLNSDYFDGVYRANDDPWAFASSPYERGKYADTLAALPRPHYGQAFEIGCSIGVLTAQLAPRCGHLLSVDVSEAALAQARQRCAALPQVELRKLQVPNEFPEGKFDLILLSEVGYYWSPADLAHAANQLLAARDVAQARGSTGLLATLTANLGYVNQAPALLDSYRALQNQQQVALAFSLPLVDWGRRRAIVRTAELTQDQTEAAVSQDQGSFEQTVLTQAAQVPALARQTHLAARADTLAQRRYAITRATYEAGRLSLTDLTLASAAKDLARRGYILALRAGWVGYYRLRGLTLFDFETQQPLAVE